MASVMYQTNSQSCFNHRDSVLSIKENI